MQPDGERADVLVVGGAIMGASVAYHLTREPGFAGCSIVVVEQDPSYRQCATTRSAGGVRQQFSTPENIAMSQAMIALLRDLEAHFGPDADVAFREHGYLVMASAAGRGTIERNVALQRSLGADVLSLQREELARRFPWLDADGLDSAAWGRSGEGWIDAASLLALFRRSALARGAVFISGRVIAIETLGASITAVRLADGRRIACGALVNAAGPDAGALARMAGIHLPVEPRKRFVFAIDCRDAPAPLSAAPLTVDPTGVWFRPEGARFICGVSPQTDDEEPPAGDLDVIDHALFEDRIWPQLATRVPAFTAVKVTGAWAGHYDYNTIDQNAIIGPHPEIANLHFCNGFSGHGLQHAAAAGRAVAELIATGGFRTLDLSRFGYGRIVRGEPLRETNVF
jgi:glycine/D-amino acid oxidase-like deaminating enzyme